MSFKEKCSAALYASIIGDALGVPVESSTRQELALCAVKNMLGYGRYDHPVGTWSDDTSMVLCTLESLSKGYDPAQLANEFCAWLFEGKWTACGYAFDAGITTVTALENIRSTGDALKSGGASEDDNGNGSLMRMLPAALFFAHEDTASFLNHIHEISAITHAHPRSKIGCGIYSLFVRNLIKMDDKVAAYRTTIDEATKFYTGNNEFKKELPHFIRILSQALPTLPKDEIYSSGYIVHTLEAAIWCFLNHSSTRDVLLEAVNLGLDTDTTGTVAGGLAGLFYDLGSVPEEWVKSLAQKTEIDTLIQTFVSSLSHNN